MEGRPASDHNPSPAESQNRAPAGGWVCLDGETYYRISSFQRLAPFLMSLPSDTDLWMFVTSGGGLTAGRVDVDRSLFPYQTVDNLHDAHHHTGPLTLIRIDGTHGARQVWEPFCSTNGQNPQIERNLYKNTIGNRLVFEEINHLLGLAFSYRWSSCDEFGWVRTSTLENRTSQPVQITVLDGLRNIQPYGAPLSLYQQSSNLVDAYKRTDVDHKSGLGIFSLSAGITDRAEALEVLRANTVWCCGLEDFRIHLSPGTQEAFRHGRVLASENTLLGQRGNYLVSSSLDLEPSGSSRWHLVTDAGLDHARISVLRGRLIKGLGLAAQVEESLSKSRDNLRDLVGSADGIQLTGKPNAWNHHFANVLFNSMRGGVFQKNYDLPLTDFCEFLNVRNREVASWATPLLMGLSGSLPASQLLSLAAQAKDADLVRLCHEYLPLHFGRRHGDPSRPWNRFSIQVRNQNGERTLNYEGNWRDIFQNWEALGLAFPGFYSHFIAKFVNASTVDGFNPYRINTDGVEWEFVTPEDPWSNIGYWGDHQIIYLLKFLEGLNRHDPTAIGKLLRDEIFSYADVPYHIKPYSELLRDPTETIVFDDAHAARITKRVESLGTDGKLLTDPEDQVYHANLLEKLLVPALSKLANLVPDAGIWMNTQRPEWNDANNALAGGGISVVTLCYLRRYLVFLRQILTETQETTLPVSIEVVDWFEKTASILEMEQKTLADDRIDLVQSKRLMDALGGIFSDYREIVYAGGFSGKTDLSVTSVTEFCTTTLEYVDHGIKANRRDDQLFHSYNLMQVNHDQTSFEISHLQEMLEGQVAVLSSGILEPKEALAILEKLFSSRLYRQDQHSFMLYPHRSLPSFLAKNMVPGAQAENIDLLKKLLAAEDQSVLTRDADGLYRFHGDFQKAEDLSAALDALEQQKDWSALVEQDRTAVLDLFEEVFRHQSYTGRSGYMHGYEGLGCIYWHMVAKLLLAVQEVVFQAQDEAAPPAILEGLIQMYFRVRAGLGYEKTVGQYGAFPTDPYSHTPADGGAKQPGMTGQVKEEVLTRFGELGVRVENGTISFQPVLLRPDEFLSEPGEFQHRSVNGTGQEISLSAGMLAFTMCQVPIIYEKISSKGWVRIECSDGSVIEYSGNSLGSELSRDLFARNGQIDLIRVGIPSQALCRI